MFDWNTYLQLAEDLQKQANTSRIREALLRSSTSRAFYAAFCLARNYLNNKCGVDKKKLKSQDYVIDLFKYSEDEAKKQIGMDLDRLQGYRNKADYENKVNKAEKLTKTSVLTAKDIIMTIDNL